ncbi:MAG: UDP-N-acetylmuramate dehydrogenase [Candidatus Caldatribacterium sp.]|uniref:UDP-N-acetylmuramate dehydrogenase n=1 Tax=Candidatus Caldatribacterium sp. TaxID=2282143 RepID=UPI00299C3E57|nr:UDP-N-acetylmuramate dehydrogenase [Candidatus Caldatribacterium sp.]MCX7729818.1 UDP-N-acetylmuramate dehydrogenase [Candidatus Caldatribacterium sp.]MDW8080453.1 UDP-N-acetylmuramate dehydrogenase [Candidatus Calescibacterium sp.]
MEGWGVAYQEAVEELFSALSRVRWFRDPELSLLTTWRIGGRALALVEVANEDELVFVLSQCDRLGIPWRVLGRGSNVLVSDRGFPGVIVRLVGSLAECRLLPENRVEAGGGVTLNHLVSFAMRNGLGGCEFLVGIPGTVGGAVVLNAGCFGGEIEQFVEEVLVREKSGGLRWKKRSELFFSYRKSSLKEESAVVLRVVFRLFPEDPQRAAEKIHHFSVLRKNSQPLEFPSAGSVFRNPPGGYAARLIEQVGCKGLRLGQAQVSPKHSNFIVNLGGARAWEVEYLMEWIRREVYRQTGIWLENEVELWR